MLPPHAALPQLNIRHSRPTTCACMSSMPTEHRSNTHLSKAFIFCLSLCVYWLKSLKNSPLSPSYTSCRALDQVDILFASHTSLWTMLQSVI